MLGVIGQQASNLQGRLVVFVARERQHLADLGALASLIYEMSPPLDDGKRSAKPQAPAAVKHRVEQGDDCDNYGLQPRWTR